MGLFSRWFNPGASRRKMAAIELQAQQRDAENAAFQKKLLDTLNADRKKSADAAALEQEELLKKMRGRSATILTGGLGDSNFGKSVEKAVLLGQAGTPG